MKSFPAVILLIFCFTNVNGQHFSPPMTIKTPEGNVTIPGQYYGSPNSFNYGSWSEIRSNTYNFVVQLSNDSLFNAKVRIDFTDSVDCLVIGKKKKEKRIEPSQTKAIARTTRDHKVLKGIPADSCWLFKTSSGAINVYSFLAEQNYYIAAIAIQKGDESEIVGLDKTNLLEMVGNNDEKLSALIEKNKLIKAIMRYNRSALRH